MKACLKMDPAERITAAEALQHPYFDGLRDSNLAPSQTLSDLRIESAKPAETTNRLIANPLNQTNHNFNKKDTDSHSTQAILKPAQYTIEKGAPAQLDKYF